MLLINFVFIFGIFQMSLPKPELRRLGLKTFRQQFAAAGLISVIASGLWHYYFNYHNEKQNEEFYKLVHKRYSQINNPNTNTYGN